MRCWQTHGTIERRVSLHFCQQQFDLVHEDCEIGDEVEDVGALDAIGFDGSLRVVPDAKRVVEEEVMQGMMPCLSISATLFCMKSSNVFFSRFWTVLR